MPRRGKSRPRAKAESKAGGDTFYQLKTARASERQAEIMTSKALTGRGIVARTVTAELQPVGAGVSDKRAEHVPNNMGSGRSPAA